MSQAIFELLEQCGEVVVVGVLASGCCLAVDDVQEAQLDELALVVVELPPADTGLLRHALERGVRHVGVPLVAEDRADEPDLLGLQTEFRLEAEQRGRDGGNPPTQDRRPVTGEERVLS